jgi:hypothetical protein
VPPPMGENGSDGVITGNAIALDADLPIGVCGVAASLVGNALGGCDIPDMEAPAPAPAATPTVVAPEGDGVGTGNAIAADLHAPVLLCGLSLTGIGNAAGLCY